MPFNAGNPPTYARLFAFVDQFTQGETADRADFDTFLADLETSLNAAFTFFDGLSDNATDQRYLGLKSAAPSLRNDTSALQDGDKYISINASDFGTLYFRRTGIWVSVATAPFSAYFLTLIGSVDAAELRGLMGLGSAATSAASAFATATQGAKADSALQVPNLLGVNVTDWNSVSATKTGFYQSDTGALNSPSSGDALSGLYIARAATAGSLIVYGINSNRIFIRQFNTIWGDWREFSLRTTGTTGNLDNFGVGVFAARFDNTATGAPSGLGTYNGLVSHYGSDTVRSQIAIIVGRDLIFMRQYNGSAWGAWARFATSDVAQFSSRKTSGTDGAAFPTGTAAALQITDTDRAALGITLATNQLTFSVAGTYLIEAFAPMVNASGAGRTAQILLYNVTQGAEIARGQSTSISNATGQTLVASAVATVAASDIIELRGIANGTNTFNGRAASLGQEIYNIVRVRAF